MSRLRHEDYFTGPRGFDHHSRWPMMLRMHGSILPQLIVPLLLVGGWATMITCISKFVTDLGTDQVLITALGFVISLALSGRLRLACRTMGLLIWIHVEERHDVDPALGKNDLLGKVSCLNLVVALAVALKHKLRFEPGTHYPDLKHLVGHLDTWAQAVDSPNIKGPGAVRSVGQLLGIPMATPNPRHFVKKARAPLGDLPLEILAYLSAYMKTLYDNGTLRDYSIYQTQTLDALSVMDSVITETDRILNTPLPLAYSIAISQITWVYILLLPFQIFHSLGWNTIPACIIAAYIILGIAFIGREIEDPFGHDVNDLPLDAFCEQIRKDMDVIMSRVPPIENDFIHRKENMPLYPLSYLSTMAWAEKSVDSIHDALAQKPALKFPMVSLVTEASRLERGEAGMQRNCKIETSLTEKGEAGPGNVVSSAAYTRSPDCPTCETLTSNTLNRGHTDHGWSTGC
ncbi:hypothetical protein BU25DRAFT_430745 [Macroventuria anomochaeta]|uniref:Uncharacterized protein n=1 Tax=Macroventuria anomochaeta TaxID=301207 RepID=A0ACB6S4I1_9PLEO|nr:uncharacterized protein BU25DRAFT_430745 [Macroventuria anomochaeta]KAF2628422.1 hypothetical protein BU25DRAFT_430745 [Macroventuria anomochaeta]